LRGPTSRGIRRGVRTGEGEGGERRAGKRRENGRGEE